MSLFRRRRRGPWVISGADSLADLLRSHDPQPPPAQLSEPASPEAPSTCSTCRYAELTVDGDDPRVECRRFPPQLLMAVGVEIDLGDETERTEIGSQGWPIVQSEDWCGEWAGSVER